MVQFLSGWRISGAISARGARTKARSCMAGCGEDEIFCVEDLFAVEKKVEVDEARTFGDGGRAVAAHPFFDGEQSVHEVYGGQVSFEKDDRV